MFNFRHREHIDHHNPLQFVMKKRIVMLASSFVHHHVFARLDVCACASWTASVYLHQRQCSWWVVYWSVRLHVRVPVCQSVARSCACTCACKCVRLCVLARAHECASRVCTCVHHFNICVHVSVHVSLHGSLHVCGCVVWIMCASSELLVCACGRNNKHFRK